MDLCIHARTRIHTRARFRDRGEDPVIGNQFGSLHLTILIKITGHMRTQCVYTGSFRKFPAFREGPGDESKSVLACDGSQWTQLSAPAHTGSEKCRNALSL